MIRRPKFKSWTWLFAFHIAVIPLRKACIQLFLLQLWANIRAIWKPLLEKENTEFKPDKLCLTPRQTWLCVGVGIHIYIYIYIYVCAVCVCVCVCVWKVSGKVDKLKYRKRIQLIFRLYLSKDFFRMWINFGLSTFLLIFHILSDSSNIYEYIYIYSIYVCIYICVYIYGYIHMSTYTQYIYVYIYISCMWKENEKLMVKSIFFIKVQNYPLQKYWIHQFNILLCSLCFVSLLPVAFYSWPHVFHTDPALLYCILPCIIPLITWYFMDSAYEL